MRRFREFKWKGNARVCVSCSAFFSLVCATASRLNEVYRLTNNGSRVSSLVGRRRRDRKRTLDAVKLPIEFALAVFSSKRPNFAGRRTPAAPGGTGRSSEATGDKCRRQAFFFLFIVPKLFMKQQRPLCESAALP